MRVAISRCLLGDKVRYDGGAKPVAEVLALAEKVEVVRVCPEGASGLPVPRPAAEQREGRVYLADGTDVTAEFALGSERSAAVVRRAGAKLAVLKAKSPSCGVGQVYDGTYTGRLVPGDGVFAAILEREGVVVATEDDVRAATRCRIELRAGDALLIGRRSSPYPAALARGAADDLGLAVGEGLDDVSAAQGSAASFLALTLAVDEEGIRPDSERWLEAIIDLLQIPLEMCPHFP